MRDPFLSPHIWARCSHFQLKLWLLCLIPSCIGPRIVPGSLLTWQKDLVHTWFCPSHPSPSPQWTGGLHFPHSETCLPNWLTPVFYKNVLPHQHPFTVSVFPFEAFVSPVCYCVVENDSLFCENEDLVWSLFHLRAMISQFLTATRLSSVWLGSQLI